MKLEFVAPVYTVAEKRLLFTRTLDGNQRLDITAQPINPCVGILPEAVEQAFKAVLLNEPGMRDEVLHKPAVWSALYKGADTEADHKAVLNLAAAKLAGKFPELKDDERTAYVCPIVAGAGAGYRHGYVVAWEREDALDVAEFMAGARADIYLDLLSYNGEFLGGELLGDLSYSDVESDTDNYRRIVEGENFALAMETHLGIEAPEPQDPEYPGAELLETFTKMD